MIWLREADVVIIGAGPAGLTAATYCARANLSTVVLGDVYGSQVAMTDYIENYPGFPDPVQGMELVELMLRQAERYGAENEALLAQSIDQEDGGFLVHTQEEDYRGQALIIATGAHPKKLGVEGEEKLENRGVSYCYICDGALYKNSDVAVMGLGNGLARGALYLAGLADQVYMLNVQGELNAEALYKDRIEETGNIKVYNGVAVQEIMGDEIVSAVKFETEGETHVVDVDGVFVEYGWAPNTDLARQLGLEIRGEYVRVDRETMSTNVPGVFAAGDITGGRRQVATAVGEGASAALSVIKHLKRG